MCQLRLIRAAQLKVLLYSIRVEFDAVDAYFPEMEISECVQLAHKRLNNCIMVQYGMTISEVHRGSKFRGAKKFEAVLSAAPYPMSPKWHQLRKMVGEAEDMFKTNDRRQKGLTLTML